MPNLNPHLANDRLVLHTVHTDDGATELYFGRASDDMALDWEGSLLFFREGGVTYKLTTDDDVPMVLHVEGNRVRVSDAEDQPPFYDDTARARVLFDSAQVKADGHYFMVEVRGCTRAQAEQVIAERTGHDEDYGFEYTIEVA